MRQRFRSLLRDRRGRIVCAICAAALVLPAAAIAQFGALVYDPTNGATLIASLAKDAAILGQEVQVVENTVHTFQQLVKTHNMLHFTLQMITQKDAWKAFSHYLHLNSTVNTFGETLHWSAAINSGGAAYLAWTQATNRIAGNTAWMSSELLGSSVHLANLAFIEATDSHAIDGLDAIGKSRVAQSQSMDAIQKLEKRAESDADTDNTLIGQLNIANGAHVAQLRLAESNATVNTALLQQQLLANMAQRNLLVDGMTIYSQVDTLNQSKAFAIQGVDTFQTFDQP